MDLNCESGAYNHYTNAFNGDYMKMKGTKKDYLYNVLFHYNPHRAVWVCFPSDKKREYFNGKYKIWKCGTGTTVMSAYDDWLEKEEKEFEQ